MNFAPFHHPACAPFLRRLLGGLLLAVLSLTVSTTTPAAELVELDAAGVIRWRADGREVALFGANYCLPSASDYRAAKRTGADLPKLIEQDFTHFARLGWDGLRLSFWGDWENSDRDGNLIANEHLDLLDRCIAEAKKRGLYILFSPITNHASWWPDMKEADAPNGFSKFFEKSKLGTDPKAIAVQANYLRQIMAHVNPYTGVALKDEPQILFVELINEPWHHSDDQAGSVAYINALTDAVRTGGCQKLVFHNVSQDFAIAPAIRASRAQGVTFGWYPTGLLNGHTLTGNYLRSVDDYPPMRAPELRGLPSLVYEFDSADMNESTMYPAMVRTFRSVGAQFAAAFSYDMLATAPSNTGWQTHLLNLVYTPRKAVASAIAAEAMRRLPRGENYGPYPGNLRFGPFRVDPDANLAEFVLPDVFMYAGDTTTAPPAPEKLEHIVGFGSSPIVSYEGLGAYFLDRVGPATWRLEVYPDAVNILDPFTRKEDPTEPCTRLISREWPMIISLPELAPDFTAQRLSSAGDRDSSEQRASEGKIQIRPGVYLLGPAPTVSTGIGISPGFRRKLHEFVCPATPASPPLVRPASEPTFSPGSPIVLRCDIFSDQPLTDIQLHLLFCDISEDVPTERVVPFSATRGYTHVAKIERSRFFEYFITAKDSGNTVRFPAERNWSAGGQRAGRPIRMFPGYMPDSIPLPATRTKPVRNSVVRTESASSWVTVRAPLSPSSKIAEYAVDVTGIDSGLQRGKLPPTYDGVQVRYRADLANRRAWLALVERDGTTWRAELPDTKKWATIEIPFRNFTIGPGILLPTGYPGNWNYRAEVPEGRGGSADQLRPTELERIQLHFAAGNTRVSEDDPLPTLELVTIEAITSASYPPVP